jgi:hypothetical protein
MHKQAGIRKSLHSHIQRWKGSGALSIAIVLILGSGLLATWEIWKYWENIAPENRSQAGINVVQTIATIAGGIAIFWNIVLARRQLSATLDQNITNRFEQAVGYLGSEQLSVRIGAVYAFERIAKDSNKDHWMIVEVLMSFIDDQCASRNKKKEQQDIFPKDAQAAITVLGRRDIDIAIRNDS